MLVPVPNPPEPNAVPVCAGWPNALVPVFVEPPKAPNGRVVPVDVPPKVEAVPKPPLLPKRRP